MTDVERAALFEILRGLMMSDNLGDVHEEIDQLRKFVGLPETTGNFDSGWSRKDMESIIDDRYLEDYSADDE